MRRPDDLREELSDCRELEPRDERCDLMFGTRDESFFIFPVS